MSTSAQDFGVACGNCGGPVFMATCNNFRGTGHEWVLMSICLLCRTTHWTDDGCHDCAAAPHDTERTRP